MSVEDKLFKLELLTAVEKYQRQRLSDNIDKVLKTLKEVGFIEKRNTS